LPWVLSLIYSVSVLIGAPKANTSQPNVTEGGSVFHCPWSPGQSQCRAIEFDVKGDRSFHVDDADLQMEFKSHQWFGATVRSYGNTILACAPLYYWRTTEDVPMSDTTGTCYLSIDNFTEFVEYAPCRTERAGPAGQGYCQGGFSADFTKSGRVVVGGPGSFYWQGQLFSATREEIVEAYYPSYFLLSVAGQLETRQVQGSYDDSYLGYSVAVGEFSGDGTEDFVTGVPKGLLLFGLVSILNGADMKSMLNFTGEQMGSYFGYAVATNDINNDGLDDLLVGAPTFMVRGSDGRLEEVGRVYIYLQRGPLTFDPGLPLPTGTQIGSRFGSSIAPLGDLNQDGFNDVAVGAPFGGEDQQGLVFVYHGHAGGLKATPSQVLSGQWASGTLPSIFGFAIRGNKDLDVNGYPDLLVGAFGADKAVLYRARPIVNTSASLLVYPSMINPEEKSCVVTNGNETVPVSCVNLSFCLTAGGKHLPAALAVRRALFLRSQQPSLQRSLRLANGERICQDTKVYLRGEKEFRDKLSSIYIALNFSLDPRAPADSHGLRPVINYQGAELIEQKAQILLDCGEDNICVPDLKLAVHGDRREVYLGDDNAVTLTFNARNEGEGGAYEAELYVVLPAEADYSGIARSNESLTQLTCSYETENQTRYVSCDLGNPMKSGTSLWAGLRFTVPRLRDTHRMVQFDLQIRRVSHPDKVIFPPPNWKATKSLLEEQDLGPQVQHVYELVNNGPSMIGHTLLELRCPMKAQNHWLIYPVEVTTQGPLNCTTSHTLNPLQLKVQKSLTTEEPPSQTPGLEHHVEKREVHNGLLSQLANLSCSDVDCWTLRCQVGLLERGTSTILKVRSRIWAETFMERAYKQYVLECSAMYRVQRMPYAIIPKDTPYGARKASYSIIRHMVTQVVWSKPEGQYAVPLWIIILAILAGLLLLALLIYVLYKVSVNAMPGLLQAILTLQHSHGESTTQTPGYIRGLSTGPGLKPKKTEDTDECITHQPAEGCS
ncbi:hypothetical protein JZ751_018151, partial [Albula glossodonta]